jgi:hypothetical protein
MMQQAARTKIEAGAVTFVVQHELWDGNLQDHSDQGVVILVEANDTTMLRFNCFDDERSYIYGPEGKNRVCRMDPVVDGNPIRWSVKQIKSNLTNMLIEAGYEDTAKSVNMDQVKAAAEELESTAREVYATGRNTVKHNRGHDIFEAGNIRFGLEVRKQAGGDGGLAIHVLSDLSGTPGRTYTEETELLAFDCFRDAPHYHYGPRNKNHRIFWDRTIVSDPLEWTLGQFKSKNLKAMIARAGYPGVAADLDQDLIESIMPALEAKAREFQPAGDVQVIDGPATPNLVAR